MPGVFSLGLRCQGQGAEIPGRNPEGGAALEMVAGRAGGRWRAGPSAVRHLRAEEMEQVALANKCQEEHVLWLGRSLGRGQGSQVRGVWEGASGKGKVQGSSYRKDLFPHPH